MLSRVIVGRKRPVFFFRLLSDKINDEDGKNLPETEAKEEAIKTKSSTSKAKAAASTMKIQELLKSMVEANKAREQATAVSFTKAPGIFKRKPKGGLIENKQEQIEEKVTAAVSEVAAALGGDTKQTEAELLSRVLGDISQSPTNLSDLVLGMKIDRTKEVEEGFKLETRGQQVRRLVEGTKKPATKQSHRTQTVGFTQKKPADVAKPIVIDIFSESRLGILKPTEVPNYGPRLETWEMLKKREITLATAQPPRNYFEKMALWTEQGKVWKFPIDNEQGLEEEAKVHFSEHVFVDSHLEGWCPERGPIRHFMELVCVGLSKNPFYTAQEKKDHIMWFKEYFESKKDILTEIDPAETTTESKISVGKTESM